MNLKNWPPFSSFTADLPLSPGYRLEQIRSADVAPLLAGLRSWYPDITVGAESCHFRESFYFEEMQLADVDEERTVYGFLMQHGDEIVGIGTLEKDDDARLVFGRIGAVSPQHRVAKLGTATVAMFERIACGVGAELVVWTATLKHPYSQRMAEAAGYTLAGIIPGSDRNMVAPGVLKRVYEALYVKLLVPQHEVLEPSTEVMTPPVRELFSKLFRSPGLRRGDRA